METRYNIKIGFRGGNNLSRGSRFIEPAYDTAVMCCPVSVGPLCELAVKAPVHTCPP